MITGAGMLAKAFEAAYSGRPREFVFASGVANSNCLDAAKFDREHRALEAALETGRAMDVVVYFSTCCIADPSRRTTAYVQHKMAMERAVAMHPGHLILRLPQLAGRSTNQHTLLNFLHARISRGEPFDLWKNAQRSVIDVADVVIIADHLITTMGVRHATLNIANPHLHDIGTIVSVMEEAVGRKAVFNLTQQGSTCPIDLGPMLEAAATMNVNFDDDYLRRTIHRYYASDERQEAALTNPAATDASAPMIRAA